MMKSEPFFII